jgi:hypothetical protein
VTTARLVGEARPDFGFSEVPFNTWSTASLSTRIVLIAIISAAAASGQTEATSRDLQGLWANITITPLQRPTALADKPFFAEQEALEWERQTPERRKRDASVEARISPDFTGEWSEMGKVVPSRRTSLIIDPPDGRIPWTPEARKARVPANEAPESYLNPKDRPLSERCIVWTEGPPMLPGGGITGFIQIVQTPDSVLIFSEMIHAARVIPLDGRPHLPTQIRQWTGDSRGHWDENTLVVDTTNFTDETKFLGSTRALHVVERFTRADADTINYSFTVDDPSIWTRPWTAETALTRIPGPLFEYACHEGNYSIENILRAGRAEEKASEASAK